MNMLSVWYYRISNLLNLTAAGSWGENTEYVFRYLNTGENIPVVNVLSVTFRDIFHSFLLQVNPVMCLVPLHTLFWPLARFASLHPYIKNWNEFHMWNHMITSHISHGFHIFCMWFLTCSSCGFSVKGKICCTIIAGIIGPTHTARTGIQTCISRHGRQLC